MRGSTRLIVSILVVAALAIAFWVMALAPKREKADELSKQVESMKVTLAEAQSTEREALAARHQFPADYRQLVVLGQAVPAGDETSSLLVELDRIAAKTHVKFESIALSSSGETAAAPAPVAPTPATPSAEEPNAVQASETVPPTEAAASLLPLGASIGPAGLAVMPYSLSFKGDFFQIADLIHEIDSLVRTSGSTVAVDGRLLTLSGFALNPEAERGFPHLEASFMVTSYVTPPSQGVTAGATPSSPPATVPAAEGTTPEATTSVGGAS